MSDLINRQDAIDAIFGRSHEIIKMRIEKLPSAQKKGEWIATHETNLLSNPDSITYVCSECGYKIYTLFGMPSVTNFCSKCGADMRKGEENGEIH